MSSGDEDVNSSPAPLQTTKKRRIQRACDICRRKKSDGVQMPKNRCTNCISFSSECTYVEPAEKRGSPKGYVESLEKRVEILEELLRRFCPNETAFKELLASLDGNQTLDRPPVNYIANQAQPDAGGIGTVASAIRCAIEGISETSGSSRDPHGPSDPVSILADNVGQVALAASHNGRFLGKSSWGGLIHTAIELKKEHTGDEGMFGDPEKPVLEKQSAKPWGMQPWERESYATASPDYNFPDVDLARHCIDLYFKCINLYLPLLHRPTFDKNLEEDLHFTDERFASVYLLVCANGARYSDNPRVLLDGLQYSSGWKWFEQVQIMKRPPIAPPTLYDLQLYCLCAQYIVGTSSPQSFWTMAGIGIRLAQDAGAHRRKTRKHTHTRAENELWKRAFWVLVYMDRMSSSTLGRSCAIQDEDFDLDLPVDCDDEYWDDPDPEKCFKQPPNKPSSITAFILHLKLCQIVAFSQRIIYPINKPTILLGLFTQPWEQHVVAGLDSALNKWVDSIPDHLRWDPHKEDDNFFNQSASLYALYYDIQMNIHRPFIPSPSKPSPLAFPSLAICTNAARSCSHVLDIMRERNVNLPPHLQIPAFTAGIVLLINMWGGKRSGLSTDPIKEMADVHKCMLVLETARNRWYAVAGIADVLYEFASMRNLPLPPPPMMKRDRGSDTPFSTSASESPSDPISNEIPRVIASSRRIHQESSFIGETQQSQNPLPQHRPQAAPPPSATRASQFNLPPQQASLQHTQIRQNPAPKQSTSTSPFIDPDPSLFALPVYTNELGRFPPHGQITFSTHAHHSQPQTHSPQLHPQTNDRSTMPGSSQAGKGSEPTPHISSSGSSLSYWSGHPPSPLPLQHLPHLNHISQSIRTSGLSSAQAPYNLDAAQVATGMMLDPVAGGLAYAQQQTSTYGWGSSDSLNPGIRSPSTVSPSPQSSSGSSLERVYGEMPMDYLIELSGGYSFQRHHHQGVPHPQEQQQLKYPFGVDRDAVELWSHAPAGFAPVEWCTYLPTL